MDVDQGGNYVPDSPSETEVRLNKRLAKIESELYDLRKANKTEVEQLQKEKADLYWLFEYEWQDHNPGVPTPDFLMVVRVMREVIEGIEKSEEK